VKSKLPEVLLISRLQGESGCYSSQIKVATKAMDYARPRTVLLGALEGIAAVLGIDEIAAVSVDTHVGYREELHAAFKRSYDDYFAELGIAKSAAGFFIARIPIEERPLSFIKPRHRIRTRKKREFTEQIRVACAESFSRLTGPNVSNSDTMQATTAISKSNSRAASGLSAKLDQENLEHAADSCQAST
jgi:uncharacterized protein VirK/YbjX